MSITNAPDELPVSDEFSSQIGLSKTGLGMNTYAGTNTHTHDWQPIPNDRGFYTCTCGWFGRRELSDGSMTARPALRRLKRVPAGECGRCGTNHGVDRNIGLCMPCWEIELNVEERR